MKTNLTGVEYQVRPVTRFVVTRYHAFQEDGGHTGGCGSEPKGEFDNERAAFEVATALCREEHRQLGWPVGDERIKYPQFSQQNSPSTSISAEAQINADASRFSANNRLD